MPLDPPARSAAADAAPAGGDGRLRRPAWRRPAWRWLLRLLLLAALLLGLLLATLYGWVLPRLDQWRPALQRHASQATGLQIEIAALHAQRHGVLPHIVAESLSVHDPQGVLLLQVPRAELHLSLAALWRAGIESLVLTRPELVLALPRADGPSRKPPQNQTALRWLLQQPEIRIAQGRLTLLGQPDTAAAPAPSLQLEDLELRLNRHLGHNTLALQLRPAQASAPVVVQADFSGWPQERTALGALSAGPQGQARLQAPQLSLQQLAAVLHEWLPAPQRDWLAPQHGLAGQADTELALRWRHGTLEQAELALHGRQWQWHSAAAQDQDQAQWTLDTLQTHLQLQQRNGQWHLNTPDLALRRGDTEWHSGPWTLRFGEAAPSPSQRRSRAALFPPEATQAPPNPASTAAAALQQLQLQWDQIDLAALTTLLQPDTPRAVANDRPNAASTAPGTQGTRNPPALPAPLQTTLAWLDAWQPTGQARGLQLSWQAAETDAQPAHWSVAAELDRVSVGLRPHPDVPAGVQHLSGQIHGDSRQGSADLHITEGAVRLPTVFEQAEIPVARLQLKARWRAEADGALAIELDAPEVANAHARGHARLQWRTSTDAEVAQLPPRKDGRAASRLPGHLDLQASLTQADATQVWRYLPLTVPADVRRYVQAAVQRGHSEHVHFEVRGSLQRFPFDARRPHQNANGTADEIFRISAALQQVDYRYAPHYLLGPGRQELVWPDLQGVNGELVFEGNRMELQVSEGALQAAPLVRITRGQAHIDDLLHAHLQVDVRASGPLQPQLEVLDHTPVRRMTDGVMRPLQGDGQADLRLRLGIPLTDQRDPEDDYSLDGEVQLRGNTLRWWPEIPALHNAKGRIHFTEQGFAFQQVTAQALGGPVTLQADMQPYRHGQPTRVQIRAEGTLSADGLRRYTQQALGDGAGTQLLDALSGQTDYQLEVQTIGSRPYVQFTSQLQGLGSALPAPLDKPAADREPLRFTHLPSDANGDELLELQWGERIYARYRLHAPEDDPIGQLAHTLARPNAAPRQGGGEQQAAGDRIPSNASSARNTTASSPLPAPPRLQVLEGDVLIGRFSPDEQRLAAFIPNRFPAVPAPPTVRATIAWGAWDASAWLPWLQGLGGLDRDSGSTAAGLLSAFVPDVWYAQLPRLQWGAMALHEVEAQVYLSGVQQPAWIANLRARETEGTLEYHPHYLEGTGLVRGKIARLELPAGFGQADAAPAPVPEPSATDRTDASLASRVQHLPTVDLEIDRLLFANRDWGQVALQAMNRVEQGQPSEWRIHYLTMQTPEARLTAKGRWLDETQRGRASHLISGRKRMDMQFTLEMHDAGRLLDRLGAAHLLRAGQGTLDGRLSWIGSPLQLDLPSLGGAFHLDMRGGQFLKADAGAARLLGVLSLQALPRRLTLDFRDVFSEGFAFDFVRGDVTLEGGKAATNNLQMRGVNAGVVLSGQADIVRETQDISAVVVPELDAMTASLVATAINPAVGAATFLAQAFLSQPLAQSAAREFRIHGTWREPVVERVERRGRPQPTPPTPESGNGP